jgi:hypothetical protein
MAPQKDLLIKGVLNSENKNEYFTIVDGKKFEFYNLEGEKKVFKIHHYGNGKTLYFKKNKKKSNSYS